MLWQVWSMMSKSRNQTRQTLRLKLWQKEDFHNKKNKDLECACIIWIILLKLYGVFLSSWSMTAPGYHMLTSVWTFYFTFVSHRRKKLKLVLEQPENLDFWESLSFNKPARCTPIGSTKQIVDAIGLLGSNIVFHCGTIVYKYITLPGKPWKVTRSPATAPLGGCRISTFSRELAHMTMAWDVTPLILAGFRLHRSTAIRFCI